jgi:ferredoxin
MPRLVIDQEKCLNSGQCAYLQPELFEIDEEGAPVILVDAPDGALIAQAQEAVTMCPGQAISLPEAD